MLSRLRSELTRTIKRQIAVVVFGILLLLALSQYVVQRQFLLPGFADLERQAAGTMMRSITTDLARQSESLAMTTRDWGNWSATYGYVQDHDLPKLHQDIDVGSMSALHTNFLAIVAMDGKILTTLAFDPKTHEPLVIDAFAAETLAADDPLRATLGWPAGVSGFLKTPYGPLMISSAPILNGAGQGPVRGSLILGRFLSTDGLASQIGIAGSRLNIIKPEAVSPKAVALSLGQLSGAEPSPDLSAEASDKTTIYHALADINGKPLAVLSLDFPREISQHAAHLITLDVLILLALAALALVGLIYFINRLLLAPLAQIATHARDIGNHDDLTRRLGHRGEDELARFAQSFDQMVERLAQARTDLIEKSFVAGIAEMASGAMHNLGNALTPLSVRVNSLNENLRRLPVEDMQQVTEELKAGCTDSARNADLQHFMMLVGEELSAGVSGARADADSASRQLQGIQRILTEQVRQTRAGSVFEVIPFANLLAQSSELVSQAKRDRMTIELDPGIAKLPSLRLPTTVLRQVFQNMIVNATEAVRTDSGQKGHLKIMAEERYVGGRHELYVRFQDDGQGIAADVLPKLFQRHFSTKSTDTNSGIGLHWCANALRGFGGEIYVTSEGLGKGACFHIVVPFKKETSTHAAHAA